jgi:hypothetical protein
MLKCYVTGEEVTEQEVGQVYESMSQDDFDKVVEFYTLIRLEGPDENFTADGRVVLSKKAVETALNN